MSRDVLVVDDSATVRKLVEISLRGSTLRPHFAATGAEALRRAASLLPAAILLDFVLPDTTAVEVCRALAADPRTELTPILIVTAKHERARSEFLRFPSVVDFIGKPFSPPDLMARIDLAIAGSPRDPRPRLVVERAAKLLYARLRDGLAAVPSILQTLGPGSVAPQLARGLLTPEVVQQILTDLRGLYDEVDARHAVSEEASASAPLGVEAVVDRVPGFSAKVRDARLSSLDRRILALCDGRLAVGSLADRLAIEPAELALALHGLVARGLVIEVRPQGRPRPVLVYEPDVDTFHEPLRAHLQRRATPRDLIAVEHPGQLLVAARKLHPCLVLVNASTREAEACRVARALREDRELADLAIVAVLEVRSTPISELLAAGFDALLRKPIRLDELERFLIPADLG